MIVALVLLNLSAHAGGFGGASVGFSMEVDQEVSGGLALQVEPYQVEELDRTLSWAPVELTWLYLADDLAESIDRLSVSVLMGEQDLEGGRVHALYRAGRVIYDQDQGTTDLVLGEGGLAVELRGDFVRLLLGGDLQARLRNSLEEDKWTASLGLPVGIAGSTPEDRPPYASFEAILRPGIRLVGSDSFVWNAQIKTEVGYALVRGEDLDLLVSAQYALRADSLTATGMMMAHRFGVGVGAWF